MGKSLSEDLRWRVIYYQAEGYTANKIAKRLYISETSIYKIFRIFKKWGCIKDPFSGRIGRKKLFTTEDMLVRESYNFYS